ncbi:MAG: hypothetical protein ARM1_0757 [Candidatus Micrarchaeota archaeon]|nr:MAG: hypothetical protein ARM1_0757 [Candidatus Micrarchaeota archaeon]
MTAGSGIFHQEMPKPSYDIDDKGNKILNTRNKGLQLWINLPHNMKLTDPVYRDIRADKIPIEDIDLGKVKIVSGSYNGIGGLVKVKSPVMPLYLHIEIEKGGTFKYNIDRSYTTLAFIISGSGYFDDIQPLISEGYLVIYGDGDEIRVRASEYSSLSFILLAGKPIREPIAWYGPIVMNRYDEIEEAFRELKNGTFIRNKNPLFE